MTGAKVVQKNPRALSKVYAQLGKAAQREIAVGFPRGKVNPYPETGESTAYIAAIHVYGLGDVPRRDFMAQAKALIIRNCRDVLRRVALLTTKGKTDEAEKQRERAGALGAAAIKEAIRDGEFQPLAPATVRGRENSRKSQRAARKRTGAADDKPLIDTAHMITSVTYVVRDKEESK